MEDDCLTLTIYFSELDRSGRSLLADSLLELFTRHQIEMSLLLRGVDGFGVRHEIHTDRFVEQAYDLPLVLMAVDVRRSIEQLLPELREIVASRTVTLGRGRLLREKIERLELAEDPTEATKLTVFLGRDERVGEMPAYRAVVDLLHAHGLAGATVLLGIDGTFRGRREPAGIFARRPRAPLMIISIGQADSIAGVIPSLAEILPRPIMTFEPVRICKRDGVLLREPPSFVQQNDRGFDNLQRLEIYSGVHSRYKHHPLPVEIVQALLRSSASGATVLRGVWGYAHDEPPHGDRLWSLVSQVPTITVVIEQAARMRETFAVIDTITQTAGLVTSETVRGHQATATTEARGGLSLRPLRYQPATKHPF